MSRCGAQTIIYVCVIALRDPEVAMKRTLDKIDERIIEELTRNSRLAHNDIAMKVNLSRNAVRLRIERLERDGYIKG